jgi:hypothetical protein
MTHFVIQLEPGSTQEACAFCGGPAVRSAGLALFVADSRDIVCRSCGKKHVPSLVALLELASTAERVGRIGRHTVAPPLTALLDLARAAEDYLGACPPPQRAAA